MARVSITGLIQVLEALGYAGTADNNPAVCVLKSPHTYHHVVFPMGEAESLAEALVRQVLRDEPIDITQVIQDAASAPPS